MNENESPRSPPLVSEESPTITTSRVIGITHNRPYVTDATTTTATNTATDATAVSHATTSGSTYV